MKSEKREKKNENRKMKTPVYDGELFNKYFVAKFGVDTEENEPSKF